MAKVFINSPQDFERMFKQFKAKCKREGTLREYRDRQQYIKPSQAKRIKYGKKR